MKTLLLISKTFLAKTRLLSYSWESIYGTSGIVAFKVKHWGPRLDKKLFFSCFDMSRSAKKKLSGSLPTPLGSGVWERTFFVFVWNAKVCQGNTFLPIPHGVGGVRMKRICCLIWNFRSAGETKFCHTYPPPWWKRLIRRNIQCYSIMVSKLFCQVGVDCQKIYSFNFYSYIWFFGEGRVFLLKN